ncbi:hypothetical protein FRC11_012509 [Ceratobasidium sp. 423]|nr:hypothetical protein FRC11_012509 [Ceratobasidium sp. 423]
MRLLRYLRFPAAPARIPKSLESEGYHVPRLANVQGDTREFFIFFRITDKECFKKDLRRFEPTSALDVKKNLLQIRDEWAKKIPTAPEEELGGGTSDTVNLRAEIRSKVLEANARATQADIHDAIKAAEKTGDIDKAVQATKRRVEIERIQFKQCLIAFSRTGLNMLGVGKTGDKRFDERRMNDDRVFLGDQSPWDNLFDWREPSTSERQPAPEFDPQEGTAKDPNDPRGLHGVIVIAGEKNLSQKDIDDVKNSFKDSCEIHDDMILQGDARPGPYREHEHFGFMDGISQPAIRDIEPPLPGQIQVDAGVIVMGYPGDPVPKSKRPDWCRDGSIMVFRKLQQSVLLFEKYCKDNGKRWPEFIPGGEYPGEGGFNDNDGAELFAARMVGRWKSGTPLALAPYKDDRKIGANDHVNNDFDYTVTGVGGVPSNEPSDYYCPFTAHIRKTAPRNLDPYVSRQQLASSSIVRAGITYGPEVNLLERKVWEARLEVAKARQEVQEAKAEKAETAIEEQAHEEEREPEREMSGIEKMRAAAKKREEMRDKETKDGETGDEETGDEDQLGPADRVKQAERVEQEAQKKLEKLEKAKNQGAKAALDAKVLEAGQKVQAAKEALAVIGGEAQEVEEDASGIEKMRAASKRRDKLETGKQRVKQAEKEEKEAREALAELEEHADPVARRAQGAQETQPESIKYPDETDRGLLFVCYASHLDSGFVRQTTEFGNNDFFPTTKSAPVFHGQDPIIGGPPVKDSSKELREVELKSRRPKRFEGVNDTRMLATVDKDVDFKVSDGKQVHFEFNEGEHTFEVSGIAKIQRKHPQDPTKLAPLADNPYFVTSRGGEYFFVPSIATLRSWATSSSN